MRIVCTQTVYKKSIVDVWLRKGEYSKQRLHNGKIKDENGRREKCRRLEENGEKKRKIFDGISIKFVMREKEEEGEWYKYFIGRLNIVFIGHPPMNYVFSYPICFFTGME